MRVDVKGTLLCAIAQIKGRTLILVTGFNAAIMCFMKAPARGSRPSPPLQRRPSLSLSPPDDHSSSAPHFLHRDVGKFVHCEGEDRSEHLPRQFVLLDAESSKQHSHAFRQSLSASGLPRVSVRVASSWRRDHSCIGSL